MTDPPPLKSQEEVDLTLALLAEPLEDEERLTPEDGRLADVLVDQLLNFEGGEPWERAKRG